MNQCDGCRRKLPLVHGTHYGEGYDMIGCTADRYERKYIFGMDAFRDNEHERGKLAAAIEWLESSDDVTELERDELERIVAASKAEGSNAAAVQAGKDAQAIMDADDEAACERESTREHTRYEDSLGYRQSMTDAGRGHLLP